MASPTLTPHQQRLIEDLFSELPSNFTERKDALLGIRDAVRVAMAHALQHSLNEYLMRQPQNTLDERRELVSEVNSMLRNLSLAFKCPRTGRPAILVVDTGDARHQDAGRFRFQVTDDNGKLRRTLTSNDLPLPVELMPAAQRLESLSRGFTPRRGR